MSNLHTLEAVARISETQLQLSENERTERVNKNKMNRGLRYLTSLSQRLPTILSFYDWMGKEHFSFFQTAEIGKRTPNSSVNGSGANHYPKALDQQVHA